MARYVVATIDELPPGTRKIVEVAGRQVGVFNVGGAGWHSFYFEDHFANAPAMAAQLTSLVAQGVFDRFPTLKVVLIEGGFAWIPPLLWRLDRTWAKLRGEVPHVKRAPSEYFRENFVITTQPMEEPGKPEHFHQLLEHLDMNDHLLFATDYPHWDFDAPDHAVPRGLGDEVRARIFARNAVDLFGLER